MYRVIYLVPKGKYLDEKLVEKYEKVINCPPFKDNPKVKYQCVLMHLPTLYKK